MAWKSQAWMAKSLVVGYKSLVRLAETSVVV